MAHGLVEHICGTFDFMVFKVILGLFSALVSKCPVTPKYLFGYGIRDLL